MKHILYIIFAFLYCNASAQIITTFAGDGTNAYGGDGGPATAAQLWHNFIIAADTRNNLYLADSSFYIRKVNTSDTINTFAGIGTPGFSGDGGPASAAQIHYLNNFTIDSRDNMYFNDSGRIRNIDTGGIITTIAGTGTPGFSGDGGAATAARISAVSQIAIDNSGNIYLSDANTDRVRKIDVSTGIINTIAGTGAVGFSGDGGAATAAKLSDPGSLYVDQADNLFINDTRNWRIRKVNTSGVISTICGTGTAGFTGDGGPATAAQISSSGYITGDGCGNLYFSSPAGLTRPVRKINAAGIITTLAGGTGTGYSGDGGPATAAQLRSPAQIALDHRGYLYIADGDPRVSRVRRISNINYFPSFTRGAAAYLTLCENSSASVDSLLPVIDADSLQAETWSLLTAPLNGMAAVAYSATSMGTTLATSGITYTPLIGYSGADTFTVLVTDCGGLTDTIMVYVTVSPLPVTGAISGPSVVCIASSITLADTPSGGSWAATNATATVSGSGLVTGILPGTDTIMYILTNSCGADTATHSVSVNSLSVTVTPSGPTTFCAGNNVTLSADTGTGYTYQWYNGTTAISGVTNSSYLATSAGSYKVTLTIATGCAFTSATTTVTINSLPNASITAAGTTTFCAGSSVALNATAVSGYVYQWYNTGAAISGATTASFSATASGSYKVYVTNTATGCSDSTATPIVVTVNPLPSNTISASGALTFCTGDNVTLTAATGYTYQWYNGATAISGETNNSYFATASGNYKVTITAASGCSNTSAVTSVTVNPLPTTTISATGATTFCTGGSVALSATSVAGYNYQWSNSGTNISGATTSAYTATTNGSYKVRITNTATGCMDSTASPVVVTVNPLPSNTITASGALTFCPGANVTFSAATGSGYTWQWYSGASATSGATHSTFTATTAGNYKARITNSFGCSDTSAVYTVSLYSAPTATITPAVSTGICYGDTATLTATSGSGYTYQWYIGATPISGATNTIYRTTTLANYSVRVTNSTGCVANSPVTAVVYAGPAATITGSTLFCAGGTTLHTTTGTGFSWQWYNGSTPISAATTSSYYVTVTGTYKVRVSNATGCASMSAPVTVTDILLPYIVAGGATTFCQGSSVTMTINTAGATGSTPVIYQWKRNFINISGATNGSYTATTGGSYTCYENIGGSCIATTPAVGLTMIDCSLGTSPQPSPKEREVLLWPNPTSKELTINNGTGCDIGLSDIIGKEVLHAAIVSDKQVLDISDLPNGIYFVRIVDKITGAKTVHKILKE